MDPAVEAAIVAGSVGFVTLIGTVAAQVYGIHKTSRDTKETLETQFAGQRQELDRTLNERFATAADRLGSDKPPAVRLAGAYAMAGLADDWEKNRQTCVDVLCAYLRLPYDPDPGDDAKPADRAAFRANREVRYTIIRLICTHLRPGAAVPWQGLNLDFTGVVFDGGSFDGAVFSSGTVVFAGAVFSGGKVSFAGAVFSGGVVWFKGAEFSGGTVVFTGAVFSDGAVVFDGAVFSGGAVIFHSAVFSGGVVVFYGAKFSGGTVGFGGAVFSGGEVIFRSAEFSGGEVVFRSAEFSGANVNFRDAKFSSSAVYFTGSKFSGGTVDFSRALFSGGTVDFGNAKFSGAKVYFYAEFLGGEVGFGRAEFSGGTVDFSGAGSWSPPPVFDWEDAPPAGVMLRDDDLPRANPYDF